MGMLTNNVPVLVLCIYVSFCSCGVFDHRETVEKARCYANCLTMVGELDLNDSTCESKSCLQCKQPCDQDFVSLENCNRKCESSICNQSCIFINTMINLTNIYHGNKTVISAPGVAKLVSTNVTNMAISWQIPVNSTGSVVYLLKMEFTSRKDSKDPILLKNRVFIQPNATITINDACENTSRKMESYKFYFTVVALTEDSPLVQGPKSSEMVFSKADPVESISNIIMTYNANASPNGLIMSLTVTPSSGLANAITNYYMHVYYRDCPGSGYFEYRKLQKNSRNLSININTKLSWCRLTVKIYSLIECSPSNPKIIYFEYKGCHSVPNFDRNLCCSFQPESSPESARKVRNLTYSPIQITDDFRFNTQVTWLQPTHSSCPEIRNYKLEYGDANDIIEPFPGWRIWNKKEAAITTLYFNITNILPGVQFKFLIKPTYNLFDFGQKTELLFKTSDVPLNKTRIKTLIHQILPYSRSDWISINITWSKPVFKYSSITSYDISYSTNGDGSKSAKTNKTFHVIRGIDFGTSLTYKVRPVYSHPWIKTDDTIGSLNISDPPKEDITIQNFQIPKTSEDTVRNLYTINFSWLAPKFPRNVSIYEISYSLLGYIGNELQCPHKNSTKRQCAAPWTNKTRFFIRDILPSERVEITVKPVFLDTLLFQGEVFRKEQRAPAPRDSLVTVRSLSYHSHDNKTYNFTWNDPLFQHSTVRHYSIEYEFRQITTKSGRSRRAVGEKNFSITTENIFNTSRELKNGEELTVKVTPVFKDSLISGKPTQLKITSDPLPGDSTVPPENYWTPARVALLVTGIMFLLFVMLLAGLVYRRHKKQQPKKTGGNFMMVDSWEVSLDDVRLEKILGEGAFGKVYKAMITKLPQQLSVPKRKLSTVSAITPFGNEEGYVVAVKMLQEGNISEEERREFLKEIQLMKDVGSHRNIVNMLGCGTLGDPMFLIVEFLPNGDLLHYLREKRGKTRDILPSKSNSSSHTYYKTYFRHKYLNVDDDDYLKPVDSKPPIYSNYNAAFDGSDGVQLKIVRDKTMPRQDDFNMSSDFTTEENIHADDHAGDDDDDDDDLDKDILTGGDLMAFAWQISKGMEFLIKRGYVHRDLAARNVLVGENKEAKIADFGLTRHMYNSLYQAKTNRRLPIKWMSIEAIFDQNFTEKSDVWSYGILLWELFTLGGTPYPTKSVRELIDCLRLGHRMEKPDTCSDEVYEIMLHCWQELPDDRPTFTALALKLEEMMMRNNPYFDPNCVDESRDYYHVPSFKSIEDNDQLDDNVIEEIFGGKIEQDQDPSEIENATTGIGLVNETIISDTSLSKAVEPAENASGVTNPERKPFPENVGGEFEKNNEDPDVESNITETDSNAKDTIVPGDVVQNQDKDSTRNNSITIANGSILSGQTSGDKTEKELNGIGIYDDTIA